MDLSKITIEDATTLHNNIPQIKFKAVDAPDTTVLAARATGKTEEMFADRTAKQMRLMPRGLFLLQGQTYKQLLSFTLPKMFKGWAKMGLKKNEHYFVGGSAPKHWKWQRPYTDPLMYDNVVHTYTGAAFLMLSQDGIADGNGLDVDGIDADEGRYLNKQKLDDTTFPTNRGNEKYFKDCYLHHGILITSDMPLTPEGAWLFEAEENVDWNRVNLVLDFEAEISDLWQQLFASKSKTTRNLLLSEINKLKAKANNVRMAHRDLKIPRMSYYLEASTLENLDIVGEDFIRQAKQKMSDYQFGVSILGKKPTKIEGGFYSKMDEQKHCFDGYNNAFLRDNFLENIGDDVETDCREMAFLNLNEPIVIGNDWGSHFNCLWAYQSDGYKGRFLRDMWVEGEQSLYQLADDFAKYFRPHQSRTVKLHYDHTAISKDGVRESYVNEFKKRLEFNGWTVDDNYLGHTPDPKDRFLLWVMAFDKDARMPEILFDRDLTRDGRKSMQDAGTIVDESGFKKDKRAEKRKDKNGNPVIPYKWQPHLSDAIDQVLWGEFGHLLDDTTSGGIKNEWR